MVRIRVRVSSVTKSKVMVIFRYILRVWSEFRTGLGL
jgi:hypothetical protein